MYIFVIIHLFIFLMYLNAYGISNHCHKKHEPAADTVNLSETKLDCVNLAEVNKYSILIHTYILY